MTSLDNLRFRHATAQDNVLLAEIGAETFYDSYAADNTPEDMADYLARAFSPAKQAAELADPASRFLLAELDGEVVGYARVMFGPAPEVVGGQRPIEINRFYARKAWIGQGVGGRLMQACLDEAARSGCDVVWLDVWQLNPRAIAFYRKWGFAVVGTTDYQLGSDVQDDYLMARPVNAPAAGA